ncbi:hypothetical protein P4U99_18300 [Brevibacillus agri]|uniref:hypothetical protein n=1 Tax=Brevibacillus agri TaxID=51101 RepID=UPI0021AD8FF5|nr:hypothetical protein [Brevibacillus agri]MDN4092337.1 hypothetical protein [Brevibacillus agri]MDR9506335.1 hypothetical protein [Brevibacillus agri]MED1645116.1 hypothetical protein [Brevibacillus agri]MED1654108.1 hypothetical protein [Brevibacillus agri]MED1685658.1 hypothetical protein [Brevibacillus agri]
MDNGLAEKGIALKKSADSDDNGSSYMADDFAHTKTSTSGAPRYHQANPAPLQEDEKQKERDFRKKLNQAAREVIADSIHKKVKLIVHRPDYDQEDQQEYVRKN